MLRHAALVVLLLAGHAARDTSTTAYPYGFYPEIADLGPLEHDGRRAAVHHRTWTWLLQGQVEGKGRVEQENEREHRRHLDDERLSEALFDDDTSGADCA